MSTRTPTEARLIAPDIRQLRPSLAIGDGPALAEIELTTSGGSPIPLWALLAWWRRPAVFNMCWNGDFEDDVDGWTAAGVIGVTGAASSFTRVTSAGIKYGGASGQIVCPATANTGVAFPIYQRFYHGHDYAALAWFSSAAGTTLSRLRLGVSGDIASSTTNVALSTTPTLRQALWTPSADRDVAYVAAEITAATGTTWNIDGIIVFEVRSPSVGASYGTGVTVIPLAIDIPDDWPPAPFLCVLEPETQTPVEIARVEAYDRAAQTITVTRALEGTAATSHGGGRIAVLPEIRSHYEGKGAQPAHAIVEGESCDPTNKTVWAITADGAARAGNLMKATGLGSGGTASADWLIDPHLLNPDDYVANEVSVEVWARLWLHNGLTSPTATLRLAPETATVSGGDLSSLFGSVRFANEWGSLGKPLVKPSSGGAYRFCRLGTLRFPVDRARAVRSRLQLQITWTAATSGEVGVDYLILVPSNSRACSPTGRANDSNYPKFIASTQQTTKRILTDLAGLVSKPPGGSHPDHGLGGALIELPPDNVDFLLKFSNLVPDDPTANTSSETDPTTSAVAHIAVTPRVCIARGN